MLLVRNIVTPAGGRDGGGVIEYGIWGIIPLHALSSRTE
jgi:hypothetical protein